MTLDDIAKKYAETTDAICMCGVKKYHESVLVLLYSAIDALSWLYSDQMDVNKRNVGDDYKKWVITFLLPNLEGYNCTATEIYLARCSVLHTYSAVAKYQKNNRIISYICGEKEYINRVNKIIPGFEVTDNKIILVHIGDLVSAYISGTCSFFKQIKRNTELFNKVIKKASNYYTDTTQIINLIIEKKGNFNE